MTGLMEEQEELLICIAEQDQEFEALAEECHELAQSQHGTPLTNGGTPSVSLTPSLTPSLMAPAPPPAHAPALATPIASMPSAASLFM